MRPPYNVDGAFSFLYPALGILRTDAATILCFTVNPDRWDGSGLRLYGTFRSRLRAREAFETLSDLLLFIGHREPWSSLPKLAEDRGARIIGIRRLKADLLDALEEFLAGDSERVLELLALRLLEKPGARHEAKRVEEDLRTLASFYESDTHELFEARQRVGWSSTFVPQQDRDSLFIKAKGEN